MCGIIGCIGEDNVTPFLLDGLRKESYRGYDSSGVAILNSEAVCLKAVGKLAKLEEKVTASNPSGPVGIGHNRWATHGAVTETNAHPHTDCHNQFFIVHNGIIENYTELKHTLTEKGHIFATETDSEVLAHLIEYMYKDSLEDAVRQALQLVKGTYGLLVISTHEPDKIIAARLSSPLVLSVNSHSGYVASDPAALLSRSNEMVFLDDGEIAVITAGTYTVADLANRVRYKAPTTLTWTSEETELAGYPHFMLKEIHEQPDSLRNTLRGRLLLQEGTSRLGGLREVVDRLQQIERLTILGCGTAYHAGLVGEYMLEEFVGLPTEVDIASEFRYRQPIASPHSATLVISQSGETADTLAALQEVKRKHELTIGIVNVVGSSIAREIDAGLYNHAGPEIGVASTKAFTSQVAMLALLTVYLGRQRHMSFAAGEEIIRELTRLPEMVSQFLIQQASHVQDIAEKLLDAHNVLFVGRKYNYPIALEGALKLKEVSYIHAEGYSAGELKHGALALIDKQMPTIAMCPSDSVYDKTISNMQEIKSRSGPIIAIASEGNEEIYDITEHVIHIPTTVEMLTPILTVLPLQLLAYHIGLGRGLDVDKPRNLAKSVTVE